MRSARRLGIPAMIMFVLFLLSGPPVAYAGKGSQAQPPGSNQYGLKVQGDAAGTKLYGTLTIEYTSNQAFVPTTACTYIQAVVRLSKGNELQAFGATREMVWDAAGTIPITMPNGTTRTLQCTSSDDSSPELKVYNPDPGYVQDAITEALWPQIRAAWFKNDTTLEVFLKNTSALSGTGQCADVDCETGYVLWTNIVDVELAVH